MPAASCSLLFEEASGRQNTGVRRYENVLTGIALLTELASEELTRQDLEKNDEALPLMIGVRVVEAE